MVILKENFEILSIVLLVNIFLSMRLLVIKYFVCYKMIRFIVVKFVLIINKYRICFYL